MSDKRSFIVSVKKKGQDNALLSHLILMYFLSFLPEKPVEVKLLRF